MLAVTMALLTSLIQARTSRLYFQLSTIVSVRAGLTDTLSSQLAVHIL